MVSSLRPCPCPGGAFNKAPTKKMAAYMEVDISLGPYFLEGGWLWGKRVPLDSVKIYDHEV